MAKTYKVGVAAMVHDHVWGELAHWKSLPNVELVAAGDVNAPLRDRAKSEFGVSCLYETWQEMVEREDLDIVQAAAENNAGADIVEACAAKGIHVISEKPMAATLAQAERMLRAVLRGRDAAADQLADRLVSRHSGMGAASVGGRHRQHFLHQVSLRP